MRSFRHAKQRTHARTANRRASEHPNETENTCHIAIKSNKFLTKRPHLVERFALASNSFALSDVLLIYIVLHFNGESEHENNRQSIKLILYFQQVLCAHYVDDIHWNENKRVARRKWTKFWFIRFHIHTLLYRRVRALSWVRKRAWQRGQHFQEWCYICWMQNQNYYL